MGSNYPYFETLADFERWEKYHDARIAIEQKERERKHKEEFEEFLRKRYPLSAAKEHIEEVLSQIKAGSKKGFRCMSWEKGRSQNDLGEPYQYYCVPYTGLHFESIDDIKEFLEEQYPYVHDCPYTNSACKGKQCDYFLIESTHNTIGVTCKREEEERLCREKREEEKRRWETDDGLSRKRKRKLRTIGRYTQPLMRIQEFNGAYQYLKRHL